MTENPYTPPTAEPADSSKRSIICGVMFWLAGLLGVLLLGATLFNGFHNARFLLANQMGLPPYVLASTALHLVCGAGLLGSAGLWRSRRVPSALASFFLSVVATFLGPLLLLKLLV